MAGTRGRNMIGARGPAEIENLILRLLGQIRKRDPAGFDPLQPFNELGFDSLDAITLTGELERELGISIDPALILDHPSPREFAAHLAIRMESA